MVQSSRWSVGVQSSGAGSRAFDVLPPHHSPLSSLFVEQSAHVAASATALFPPIGVPVGAVGAGRAALLAALDHLLAKPHLGPIFGADHALAFELCPGQDQQTAEVVLVEVPDRVEEIAVEGHLRPLRAARTA